MPLGFLHGMCAPDVDERIIQPRIGETQVRHYAIPRGRIYPTVCISKEELDRLAPSDSKRVVVIRDLRDALVSAYFSFKHSHPVLEDGMAALRQRLGELNQEASILHLLDDFLPECAKIQLS